MDGDDENDNVTNTGLLTVGGTAGGSGQIDIGWYGMLLVFGNAAVGGAAGAGAVMVGDSADDAASFSMTGALSIGATGLVTLGGADATVRASAIAVAITRLLVALPRTISSSRITFAGLKKCVPITACGRLVAPARARRSFRDIGSGPWLDG